MPVVRISLRRFSRMVGVNRQKILERLPYVGLDIEGVDKESVRVEYSPNRPDFGTDFGIARALRGLLGKETGLPNYPISPSGVTVSVDSRLKEVRPIIACAVATDLHLDDEDIRQIISLQEDLHNGLGRRRKVVAIGLHDMDAIRPPLEYKAVGASFKFKPLGGSKPATIASILSDTPEGRSFGGAFGGKGLYPVITDSRGVVLSFPPIINGDATRVTGKTKRIFVDVTGTQQKGVDDVLAVMATTLAEAGAMLGSVRVQNPGKTRVTPDLRATSLRLDTNLVNSVLGLGLSQSEIAQCLGRSRLDVKGRKAYGARYRVDLLHPVDLAEEVALGYGVDRIVPIYPPSRQPGKFDIFEDFLDSTSTVMAGEGMIEIMTYELTDATSLYSKFARDSSERIEVLNPKTLEHSVLRDALLPTIMASLSGNVKSDYPQRVFEIGRVYSRSRGGISESWHLGCLIAHSQSTFTEAKMYLESACRILSGEEATAKGAEHWAFSPGRSAAVWVEGTKLGHVGELRPEAIDSFGLGVPVSGFEVDLSSLFERLK